MNRITRIVAITLSFAAAGSAFAESPEVNKPQAFVSSLGRAEVQAEVLKAHAAGTLAVNDFDLGKSVTLASTRSRADVRAETLAAIANGELRATSGEIYAPGVAAAPQRHAVSGQIAAAGR